MTALRFFASGSYQMDIGKNIYVSVSQPTVSRCIHEVINIITRPEIMREWIKFPNTLAEMNELRTGYMILHIIILITINVILLFVGIVQFLQKT